MNLMEPLQSVGRRSQTSAAVWRSCLQKLPTLRGKPHLLSCGKEKEVHAAGAWYHIAGGFSAFAGGGMRCCPCVCCSCSSPAWLVPDASPTLVSPHSLTAPMGRTLRDAGSWAHILEGRKAWGQTASACLAWFPSPELGSGFHVSMFRQMQPCELGLQYCCRSCWQA